MVGEIDVLLNYLFCIHLLPARPLFKLAWPGSCSAKV